MLLQARGRASGRGQRGRKPDTPPAAAVRGWRRIRASPPQQQRRIGCGGHAGAAFPAQGAAHARDAGGWCLQRRRGGRQVAARQRSGHSGREPAGPVGVPGKQACCWWRALGSAGWPLHGLAAALQGHVAHSCWAWPQRSMGHVAHSCLRRCFSCLLATAATASCHAARLPAPALLRGWRFSNADPPPIPPPCALQALVDSIIEQGSTSRPLDVPSFITKRLRQRIEPPEEEEVRPPGSCQACLVLPCWLQLGPCLWPIGPPDAKTHGFLRASPS
jgi:hypothetical protein